MLSLPEYIQASGVHAAPIAHAPAWTEDDYPTFYVENDGIQKEISATTTAGAIALALGCLEWVAWRMSSHASVDVLLHAIEAMWAATIDPRHVRSLRESPLAPKRRDWLGAERGPVWSAYAQLKRLQEARDANEPASPEASCALRLARYVLPSTVRSQNGPFTIWWKHALGRVTAAHPKTEEGSDDIGPPVPREALDPNVDYRALDAAGYIRLFRARLDESANPFLVAMPS